MTSYDGKCLSFIPGKEVVNREPPVSKYVVEKLYRVHRSRVLQCESVVDCHVHIPKFLTDQTWKKLAAKHKEQTIMHHNEEIYQRLSKVENEESAYTKQTREHIRRVKHKATYMKHLKEVGRLRKLLKIQKENEHMAKRLERARPEYSLKECKQWYKYHESFKNGRRSDPTAGHIMRGMRGLLPSSLPPLESKVSLLSEDKIDESKENEAKEGSFVSLPKSQSAPSKLASIRGLPLMNESSMLSVTEFGNSLDDIGFIPSMTTASSVEARLSLSREGNRRSRTGSRSANESKYEETHDNENENSDDSDAEYDQENFETEDDAPGISSPTGPGVEKDEESVASKDSARNELDKLKVEHDKIVLLSRPMTVSNDSKNVVVQVCVNKSYDENLYIQVYSTSIPPRLYSERAVSIDTAYDIITSAQDATSASNIAKVAGLEDMHALRAMLIEMFKEADDDGNGYLTFDEFQNLMEKVELGISPQELRFVISEADENENGVVDYHEFVPLAVDMIQSFRARDKAKKINRERDDLLDDQIMRSLSREELHEMSVLCLQRIRDLDTKKYGVIRSNDLKRCLSANPPLGLTETEVSLICQMLPRDPFGRCVYSTFEEVLLQVRFLTMKNAVLESQGSNLQKYLLEICKEEELRLRRLQGGVGSASSHHNNANSSEDSGNYEGLLPFRSLVTLLCNSPRLSLSRLQVMVIMSEASVLDGMINYYQFVPVVSKTIELMFEPKALRQRAELIETTDLSPEALLQGMTSEMFEQRLRTLFKSYDVDHSGTLEEHEFIACLESLDLQLTKGEMAALMSTADVSGNGSLQFEEFVQFFTHNLIHLEREKHIRLLQQSIHGSNNNNNGSNTNDGNKNGGSDNAKSELNRYIEHLTSIFKLADTENTGQLHHQEISEVLKSLEVNISQFELDILLSELDANGNGMIMYADFIPSCAELLRAFRANEKAQESRQEKEQWAESKANKLVQASNAEIQHIVKYLKERIHLVEETVEDPLLRVTTMQEVLRNPHSGLSRTESNLLLGKLFTTSKHNHHNHFHSNHHSHHNNGLHHNNHSPLGNHHKHQPILRTNLTNHELHSLVVEARKQSIMRNLLEDRNPDSLKVSILRQLETECQRLKNENQLESDSNLIPVSSCFQVLEKAVNLRLHRAEIIAIISWADCHDSTGLFMDVKKFAEHAAAVLGKIKEAEFVETTAAVLDKSGRGLLDEHKVMNGLRSKEIEDYFVSKCEKFVSENESKNESKETDSMSTIPSETFLEIIRTMPKAFLTEREAVAVLASAQIVSNSQSVVSWKEFIPFAAETIQSLLKERVMQRRVLLYKATEVADSAAQEEALSTMTNLAEKFIEYVKVRSHLESVVSVLPDDASASKRPATSASSGNGGGNDDNAQHGECERVVLIALSMFEVPMLSKKYVKHNLHDEQGSMSSTSGGSVNTSNSNVNKNTKNNQNKINHSNHSNSNSNSSSNSSNNNSSSALFHHAIKARLSMLPKLIAKVTVSVLEEDSSSLLLTHNNANTNNSNSNSSNSNANNGNNNNNDREIFIKIREIVETSIEISDQVSDKPLKLENDNEDNDDNDDLVLTTPSIRTAFESEIKLPVRLPSIALLDSDLAQEFALNLLDRIYMEYEDEADKFNPNKMKVNIIP